MNKKAGRPTQDYGITKSGIRFMFWIDPKHIEVLEAQAKKSGKSKAEIVRNLIEKYLINNQSNQ